MQFKFFLILKIELEYWKLILDDMPGAGNSHMTNTGTGMTNILF